MEAWANDEELGVWLHDWLTEEYGVETEDWATERVGRVIAHMERVRSACPAPGASPYPLAAEILWVGAMNAFAAPGRYVYITRELLQRAASDDPIAFVLAHEIAHHDLGHVSLLRGWLSRARNLPGSFLIAVTVAGLEKQIFGPERERAADSYALDLCLAAGYDGLRCLDALEIAEAHLLDHGDLDGVFGSDEELLRCHSSTAALPNWGWLAEARRWGWQHLRGYPSLRERKAALLTQLHEYGITAAPGSRDAMHPAL